MKRTKRILCAVMLAILAMITIIGSCAAEETWHCTSCGNETATGKFCSECGAKRPETADVWICQNCGHEASGKFCSECGASKTAEPTDLILDNKYEVKLKIHFDRNLLITYDVDLYLDNVFIVTLEHGTDYTATMNLASGTHKLDFYAHEENAIRGGTSFDVNENISVDCYIKARTLEIDVEQLNVKGSSDQALRSFSTEPSLTLDIKCEKNAAFSKYDVEVYIDREYITTIPHGKTINQTVLLEPGNHRIVFYSAKDSSVSGSTNVSVTGATTFRCEIHCKKGKINIDSIKLTHE